MNSSSIEFLERSQRYMRRSRRSKPRFTLFAANAALIILVAAFILQSPAAPSTSSAANMFLGSHMSAAPSNPIDQLSSADIALTVARMSSLPEATAITNQSQSQAVALATAIVAADTVAAKPQVVATSLKSSADITTYVVQSGDSVTSLSQKFGITSDSIRWSNGLSSEVLTPGAKLKIPPVNGIVYTIKSGDTIDTVAQKFSANREKIVAFNDTEMKGLVPGVQIMVPDGTQAVPMTAAQVAARTASNFGTALPWGAAPIYGYNGYDYGYCTWYVANKIAVPANWGNANTWDNYAPASGWRVSTVPTVGAIAQSDKGAEGHVAYVEAVSDDGTMLKYSDMNGLAGFGRVGYSDWVPNTKFMHYISH